MTWSARLAQSLLLLLTCGVSSGAQLTVTITDQEGNPVENAVVTLHNDATKASAMSERQIMDQIDKTFVPHVLVVEKGTPVYFPNKDDIRHHVYSLSETKSFELPLYQGTPADPVVFDRTGVVSLGCNIHDWMSGYIYVVDTPYFARSGGDGRMEIAEVPAGEYRMKLWHPQLADDEAETTVQLADGSPTAVQRSITLRRKLKIIRRIRSRDGGY